MPSPVHLSTPHRKYSLRTLNYRLASSSSTFNTGRVLSNRPTLPTSICAQNDRLVMTTRSPPPASAHRLPTAASAHASQPNSRPSCMYLMPKSHLPLRPSSHSQNPINPSTAVQQSHFIPQPQRRHQLRQPASAAPSSASTGTPTPGGASQRMRMHSSTGKPCHNCRRRRLRCDRSWPTCHKCVVSGQECLGYGKLFVWTQGIDEHGKVKSSSGRRVARSPALNSSPPTASSTPNQSFSAFSPPASAAAGPSRQPSTHGLALPQFQHVFASRPASPSAAASESVPNSAPSSSGGGALTDPVFQDLDRNSRYYLAYCK